LVSLMVYSLFFIFSFLVLLTVIKYQD
jgi:hypothetical protein